MAVVNLVCDSVTYLSHQHTMFISFIKIFCYEIVSIFFFIKVSCIPCQVNSYIIQFVVIVKDILFSS